MVKSLAPSSKLSFAPLTTMVFASFQLPPSNFNSPGDTVASPVSDEVIFTTTSPVGWVGSCSVNDRVLPSSPTVSVGSAWTGLSANSRIARDKSAMV